jgi:hypothetical protein
VVTVLVDSLLIGVSNRKATEMTRIKKDEIEIRELGQLVTAIERINTYFLRTVKEYY